MNREELKEGWVQFTRYHCKEGYLDRWSGDCADNPNNATKSKVCLSSFKNYWRCNGGKWIDSSELGGSDIIGWLSIADEITASEIWNQLLKTH